MSLPREVKLIRRVSFSSGHRYWLPILSAAQNRKLFGKWASRFNHGHNYVLEAELVGAVQSETGMVVNIKDLDAILQSKVVDVLDQKSLNDEVPFFKTRSSSVENILTYLKAQVGEMPTGTRLTRLTLYETPLLWGTLEWTGSKEAMTITRSYEFAASHRLHNPQLSESENAEIFGKCSNPAGHGHNYILEVTVGGDPDPRSGMLVDLTLLDRAVEEKVVDRYDHKNLSEDLPEFKGKIATSEVVAQQIWSELEDALPAKLVKVRLQETARNVFEVSAS